MCVKYTKREKNKKKDKRRWKNNKREREKQKKYFFGNIEDFIYKNHGCVDKSIMADLEKQYNNNTRT